MPALPRKTTTLFESTSARVRDCTWASGPLVVTSEHSVHNISFGVADDETSPERTGHASFGDAAAVRWRCSRSPPLARPDSSGEPPRPRDEPVRHVTARRSAAAVRWSTAPLQQIRNGRRRGRSATVPNVIAAAVPMAAACRRRRPCGPMLPSERRRALLCCRARGRRPDAGVALAKTAELTTRRSAAADSAPEVAHVRITSSQRRRRCRPRDMRPRAPAPPPGTPVISSAATSMSTGRLRDADDQLFKRRIAGEEEERTEAHPSRRSRTDGGQSAPATAGCGRCQSQCRRGGGEQHDDRRSRLPSHRRLWGVDEWHACGIASALSNLR